MMLEENRKIWTAAVKKLIEEIAPDIDEYYDSVCVFYCPETDNFGVYNTSQDVITDIVTMLNKDNG